MLNAHVEFTNEFIFEHKDGSKGIGGSPKGETISIYEDRLVKEETVKLVGVEDVQW